MERALQIEVKDSLFDPHSSDREARFRPKISEDRTLYRVFLYLDGPDLPFVQSVTYFLHPTFVERVRTVSRTSSNPNCKLEIWTWGLFEVEATVVDKTGARFQIVHPLQYDRDLKKEGAKFTPVG